LAVSAPPPACLARSSARPATVPSARLRRSTPLDRSRRPRPGCAARRRAHPAPKSAGMVTTKEIAPRAIRLSASAALSAMPVEAVIARDLQRRDHGAGVAVVAGASSAAGRLLGSLLMAKPNSTSCIDRHAQHHREGDAVAPHLDELLGSRHRAGPRRSTLLGMRMLSLGAGMNWMKTSSRLVSPGSTLTPCTRLQRRQRRLELLPVAADDMQRGAERARPARRHRPPSSARGSGLRRGPARRR
jgi:hypothetical protein